MAISTRTPELGTSSLQQAVCHSGISWLAFKISRRKLEILYFTCFKKTLQNLQRSTREESRTLTLSIRICIQRRLRTHRDMLLTHSSLGEPFTPPDRDESTSSPIALNLANDWYTSCRVHKACKLPHEMGRCPTRLIDIGLNHDSQWKVQTFSKEALEYPEYMSLSYRWGSSNFIRLTGSNIRSLHLGRDIADLPLTFREAFIVARRFKIRYIVSLMLRLYPSRIGCLAASS